MALLITCSRCALPSLARKGQCLMLRLGQQRLSSGTRHSKLKEKFKKLDFETSTGVQHDTLLYTREHSKINRLYAAGSVFIAFCCLNSAHLIYTTMKHLKPPVQSDGTLPWYMWWENFYSSNEFVPKVLALIIVLTGVAVVWMTNASISHQIKSITLLRGGERVLMEHYTFLGGVAEIELPLSELSAVRPKTEKDNFLMRVKGQRLNYTLDSRGQFHDLKLFNSTVGLSRFKTDPLGKV